MSKITDIFSKWFSDRYISEVENWRHDTGHAEEEIKSLLLTKQELIWIISPISNTTEIEELAIALEIAQKRKMVI